MTFTDVFGEMVPILYVWVERVSSAQETGAIVVPFLEVGDSGWFMRCGLWPLRAPSRIRVVPCRSGRRRRRSRIRVGPCKSGWRRRRCTIGIHLIRQRLVGRVVDRSRSAPLCSCIARKYPGVVGGGRHRSRSLGAASCKWCSCCISSRNGRSCIAHQTRIWCSCRKTRCPRCVTRNGRSRRRTR